MSTTLRRIIVVDTETTGLDLVRHRPVEVAWLGWRSTGAGVFVPPHTLAGADPRALEINDYRHRIDGRPVDQGFTATRQLHEVLTGASLAGANVRFDAAMLAHLFRAAGLEPEPWHHRLVDIEAYAAGVLGIPPYTLAGLRELCQMLDLDEPSHGAWDDACAAANVLDAVCPTRHPHPAAHRVQSIQAAARAGR